MTIRFYHFFDSPSGPLGYHLCEKHASELSKWRSAESKLITCDWCERERKANEDA